MAALDMRMVGDMRFPGRPDIMSDVRIYATRWLVVERPETAEDEDLLDNLRLLATELSANAIKHTISGRWRRGSFRVRMRLDPRRVRVEVMDQGWWSRPRLRNDLSETSGRGLHIVEALAATWGVRRRWFGRAVWFELPIPSQAPSPPRERNDVCRTSIRLPCLPQGFWAWDDAGRDPVPE
ncbi:ATP-binding protein [Nonomuraea sp. NPDC026600]|uniref:ATP-binding protein n=1 Tax=Nonomuraea sp. NPDC026600 TaxID=3155363 RepID=UPI0034097632